VNSLPRGESSPPRSEPAYLKWRRLTWIMDDVIRTSFGTNSRGWYLHTMARAVGPCHGLFFDREIPCLDNGLNVAFSFWRIWFGSGK